MIRTSIKVDPMHPYPVCSTVCLHGHGPTLMSMKNACAPPDTTQTLVVCKGRIVADGYERRIYYEGQCEDCGQKYRIISQPL